MFEFSLVRKYLVPKRKQISVSLIALMSVTVITLVVWLVLVFLSVTEGIERNWLNKLTSLNAPIRITPSTKYFSSYYYRIDELSSASDYSLKSIGEKKVAEKSDPYLPQEDAEIPAHWPSPVFNKDGSIKDLVKEVFFVVDRVKKKYPAIKASDYETGGALLRLSLCRPSNFEKNVDYQSFLTQVSFVSSFNDQTELLTKPTAEDIDHLLYMANFVGDEGKSDHLSRSKASTKTFQDYVQRILYNVKLKAVVPKTAQWVVPENFIPKEIAFKARAYFDGDHISHLTIDPRIGHKESFLPPPSNAIDGTIERKNGFLFFDGKEKYRLPADIPIILENFEDFSVLDVLKDRLPEKIGDIQLTVQAEWQGHKFVSHLTLDHVRITAIEVYNAFAAPPKSPPLWVYSIDQRSILPHNINNELGVLLPLSYRSSDVKLGDKGYLSYGSQTITSMQEQRLPIHVAGFYDPGAMGFGVKYILAPKGIPHMMNLGNSSFALDATTTNGIGIWFDDLKKAGEIKQQIKQELQSVQLDPFWKVISFEEYEFAKDLLQQFQSDKYLFTLVGGIILIVACSNIISLLVILVNDKKKEIGILRAMGASNWSIAMVFGLCGVIMGVFSSALGSIAATITLKNIDYLASFLSFLQGHDAFNAAFYGNSLPKELSMQALVFVLVATPLISLTAGLVPALKACKLRPSQILRSD